MKKVSELEGAELDAAVTNIEENDGGPPLMYSTVWSIAGPIIERERISLVYCEPGTTAGDVWEAYVGDLCPRRLDNDPATGEGPTPLIAAMRAFVASKLGKEIEL